MSERVPVTRPAFLGRLVDANKQKYGGDENYKGFLRMANKAKNDCYEKKISVHSSFKILGAPTSFRDHYNDSLLLIFAHYAQMDKSFGTTFEMRDFHDRNISFKELVMFAVDFELLPKLLCVDDLKLLWDMKAHEHEKDQPAGHQGLTELDLDGFKDMFVRMAVFAYHKPGLKKLIITVDGFMPKNTKIINAFCTHLKLNDIDSVHHYMRTVVKATAKWEGVNEHSNREWQDILKDRKAKKYSQIDYSRQIALMQSTVSTMVTNRESKGNPTNAFGDRVREPIVTKASRASDVVQMRLTKKDPLHIKTSLLPSDFFALAQFQSSRMAKVVGGDEDNDSVNVSLVSLDDGEADDRSEVGSRRDKLPQKRISHMLDDTGSLGSYGRFEDEGDVGFDMMSVQTSVMSAFVDNTLLHTKRSFSRDYHPMLVKELDKFTYIAPRVYSTQMISTGGPFIDLGVLHPGDEVSIFQTITNCTSDLIDMETSAMDFCSEDTTITTFSKPLVPGVARTLTVTFTVEGGKKNVLACLDLKGWASRGKSDILLQVPVFYRVDPLLSSSKITSTTMASIGGLMAKHCAENDEDAFFETRYQTGIYDERQQQQWEKTKQAGALKAPTEQGQCFKQKKVSGYWNLKAATKKMTNDLKLSATLSYNRK
jgi:hypothetical protein